MFSLIQQNLKRTRVNLGLAFRQTVTCTLKRSSWKRFISVGPFLVNQVDLLTN